MQKKKGISLIVLVITVIIMIILASAIIISLNNNGVIDRAKSASDNYIARQIGEQVEIAKLQFNLKKHEAAYVNKTEADYIEECLESALGKTVTINKLGKNYKVEVEGNNKEYLCKYDGKVILRDKVEKMAVTKVYGYLDDNNVVHLRANEKNEFQELDRDDENVYSISSTWVASEVEKIIIEEPIAPSELRFNNCTNLTNIENIKNFHTENIKSLRFMFANCTSLTDVDLSDFEGNKIISMDHTFSGCSSLKKIDLSNLDTSNVQFMSGVFRNCNSLTEIDISSFETGKVTAMGALFTDCSNLTSIDLSNFDTTNVWNMSNMFCNCSNLTNINLSSFDTKNVTNISRMFYGCSSLQNLDVSNFNTNKITSDWSMDDAFYCNSLNRLNLGKNFVINDSAFSTIRKTLIRGASDIKVTTTEAISSQVKKYSNLTDDNFIIIK